MGAHGAFLVVVADAHGLGAHLHAELPLEALHRHGEVRILIGDKRYWGKGMGTEAISLLSQFAFEKLNLHKIYAYVLASNPRASEAFEKVGFTREGLLKKDRYVNGVFVDVVRLGLLRKE